MSAALARLPGKDRHPDERAAASLLRVVRPQTQSGPAAPLLRLWADVGGDGCVRSARPSMCTRSTSGVMVTAAGRMAITRRRSTRTICICSSAGSGSTRRSSPANRSAVGSARSSRRSIRTRSRGSAWWADRTPATSSRPERNDQGAERRAPYARVTDRIPVPEAAFAYLRNLRPRDQESVLRHRLEQQLRHDGQRRRGEVRQGPRRGRPGPHGGRPAQVRGPEPPAPS